MAFANAHVATVYGCNFTDHSFTVHGNLSIENPEPGLLALLHASSTGAAFDSQERHPPPRCHPETRVAILDDIMKWVDEAPRPILWLHGPAGAGKSSIAQTVAERCKERGALAASFFFARGNPGRDSINYLFPTISLHLALSLPDLRSKIVKAIEDDPLIAHRSIQTQIQKLIWEPLQSVPQEGIIRRPCLVVLDGLDECNNTGSHIEILKHIHVLTQSTSTPLRFLLTSRPEPHIRNSFDRTDLRLLKTSISLDGSYQSRRDIHTYLRAEFDRIHTSQRHIEMMAFVHRPWPSNEVVEILVSRSSGFFIYASTLVRYIDEESCSPVDRLDEVINASSGSGSTAFAELDKLYRQILSTHPNRPLLHRILGVILAPKKSDVFLSISQIEDLLGLERGRVKMNLRQLHSIIDNDPSKFDPTIFPIHASLADFIFDAERAGIFYIDTEANHADITIACLDLVSNWDKKFSRDVYIKRHTTPINFYTREELVVYIHKNWTFHFSESGKHQQRIVTYLRGMGVEPWRPFTVDYHLGLTQRKSSVDKEWSFNIIGMLEHAAYVSESLCPSLFQQFSAQLKNARASFAPSPLNSPKDSTSDLSLLRLVSNVYTPGKVVIKPGSSNKSDTFSNHGSSSLHSELAMTEDEEDRKDYVLGGYHPVKISDTFSDNQYIVVRKLGWGRSSTVWLAKDTKMNCHVALKVIKSALRYTEAALDEIKLLQGMITFATAPAAATHPGRSHIITFLDHFRHKGPNGTHVCMVFEVLGENLLEFIKRYQTKGVPMPLVRQIAKQVLLGLDYMHRDCAIIHTDIKPEHIYICIDDVEAALASAPPPQSTETQLCVPHSMGRGGNQTPRFKSILITSSQPLLSPSSMTSVSTFARDAANARGWSHSADTSVDIDAAKPAEAEAEVGEFKRITVKIANLGNVRLAPTWTEYHFTDNIQTRQYRCPEVILGAEWDTSADIWSVACVVFELITGDYLFDPAAGSTYSKDEDHIALIMELMGEIPKSIVSKGRYSSEIFNGEGELRHITKLHYWPLVPVLHDKYTFTPADAEGVVEFITPMLQLHPEKRAKAGELVHHRWLEGVVVQGEIDVIRAEREKKWT